MYHIATYFDVPREHRQRFIDAALEDGRESLANEPGTQRFELIQDIGDANRLYLNEAYDDKAAFETHLNGPYFKKFDHIIRPFAVEGPRLIEGTRIEACESRPT
jgi:(4S)-4-hydroxy-5-phosphonooxypentane-2,3-dione isomerase